MTQRQLRFDKKIALSDVQDRMIALTRGEFQDSGDVRRFKQRIIRENLLVRGARRQ